MTLAKLNGYSKEEFAEAIGWVFEHSPWVAERAWRKRPFASFDDLSTRLIQEVQIASPDEQLALLRAYPDLSTQANASEPSAAGHAQYDLLLRLREQYRKKFGFPFLFAVKDSDNAVTIEALKRRVNSPLDQEFQVALGQVFRIARFRLEDNLK